jgi:hypothetical protein
MTQSKNHSKKCPPRKVCLNFEALNWKFSNKTDYFVIEKSGKHHPLKDSTQYLPSSKKIPDKLPKFHHVFSQHSFSLKI